MRSSSFLLPVTQNPILRCSLPLARGHTAPPGQDSVQIDSDSFVDEWYEQDKTWAGNSRQLSEPEYHKILAFPRNFQALKKKPRQDNDCEDKLKRKVRRHRSLPLDGTRGFGGDVEDEAVHTLDRQEGGKWLGRIRGLAILAPSAGSERPNPDRLRIMAKSPRGPTLPPAAGAVKVCPARFVRRGEG